MLFQVPRTAIKTQANYGMAVLAFSAFLRSAVPEMRPDLAPPLKTNVFKQYLKSTKTFQFSLIRDLFPNQINQALKLQSIWELQGRILLIFLALH